jgi:hypothetical protein
LVLVLVLPDLEAEFPDTVVLPLLVLPDLEVELPLVPYLRVTVLLTVDASLSAILRILLPLFIIKPVDYIDVELYKNYIKLFMIIYYNYGKDKDE